MNEDDKRFITRHRGRSDRATPRMLAFEDRLIEIKPDQIDETVSNLRELFMAPLRAAGLLHVLHPDDRKLAFYLGLSARVRLAACRLAEPGADPMSVDFGLGRTHSLPRTPDDPLIDPVDLTTGIYAAMAVGDAALLAALAEVRIDVLRPVGVEIDAWAIDWARAMQGIVLDADWAGPTLRRALEAADPRQYPEGSSSFAFCANVANPMFALALATAADPDAFNKELRHALVGHRYYYGEAKFDPPEYQENDPYGFIALGPLAFAVMMRDRGWPIEVESDYLPRSLIEAGG